LYQLKEVLSLFDAGKVWLDNINKTEIETDDLNGAIAASALYLLRSQTKGIFESIHLDSEITWNALASRPPCRWERHIVQVDLASSAVTSMTDLRTIEVSRDEVSSSQGQLATIKWMDDKIISTNGHNDESQVLKKSRSTTTISGFDVEIVLDVGHNPAAVKALSGRIQRYYDSARPVW
jgi:hypothetical protein